MDTFQLSAALQLFRTKVPELRVFSLNQLPSLAACAPSSAYIINLDPSDQPGSHWVVLYFPPSPHYPEYFDSFGLFPPPPTIQQLIRSYLLLFPTQPCTPAYLYQTHMLQSPCAITCGLYCLTFLYCRILLGLSFTQFLGLFSPTQPLDNDEWVSRFVQHYFHLPLPHVRRTTQLCAARSF
jgi:hypothetical protein